MIGLDFGGLGFGSINPGLNLPPPDQSRFLDNSSFPIRTQVERPSMEFDTGGAVQGGVQGAAQGGAVGGAPGAAIGGTIGAIMGAFSKPSTASTSNGGLLDAFSTGLKSIGIPGLSRGGSSGPVIQTQNVGQSTTVDVQNILGGQPFGGVTASGDFSEFQAITDVFKIQDALRAKDAAQPSVIAAAPAVAQSVNYLPWVLVGVGALVLLYAKK